jgi:hypothetical protein
MGHQLISSSRLTAFRSCRRLHYFRYLLRRVPIRENDAARFGSLFHAGLEGWWLAAVDGHRAERIEAAIEAARSRWTDQSDPFELVRAEELLRGYHFRWLDAPVRAIGVEVEFRAPLVNPDTGAKSRTFDRAGKIDVLVEMDGRVKLMEHKTTTLDISPGSDYWKRLKIDDQVSGYMEGAKSLGHQVNECVYDVACRPLLRPFEATPEASRRYRKDGALDARQHAEDETPEAFRLRLGEAIAKEPERYYARGEVVRLDDETYAHAWDTWHTAREMRASEVAGIHPRNPGACVQYGRTCAYWPCCVGEGSIDDPHLYQSLQLPHPELSPGLQQGVSSYAKAR